MLTQAQPIFREGSKVRPKDDSCLTCPQSTPLVPSKGYLCCKRRVLEFDEFLKIGGCKTGKHLFSPPKSAPVVSPLDHQSTNDNDITSLGGSRNSYLSRGSLSNSKRSARLYLCKEGRQRSQYRGVWRDTGQNVSDVLKGKIFRSRSSG